MEDEDWEKLKSWKVKVLLAGGITHFRMVDATDVKKEIRKAKTNGTFIDGLPVEEWVLAVIQKNFPEDDLSQRMCVEITQSK